MENKKIVKAEIWVFLKDQTEPISRLRPQKICVNKNGTTGTMVSDGRPVTKENGKWCYRAR